MPNADAAPRLPRSGIALQLPALPSGLAHRLEGPGHESGVPPSRVPVVRGQDRGTVAHDVVEVLLRRQAPRVPGVVVEAGPQKDFLLGTVSRARGDPPTDLLERRPTLQVDPRRELA